MRCPNLQELPEPPADRRGWPWTEASPALEPGPERPRISIITATCNRATFLEETLRSVLLQGYPDLEYFVIDGGSQDGTVEILQRYDRWLAGWVSEPDRGQSHALNKGLARATGEIVTYFSSDDLYHPGTFGEVAAHGCRLGEGYGAVIGGFRFIDEHSRRFGTDVIAARLPHEGPLDLTLLEPETWRLHQESTFYARHALDAIGRQVREDLYYNADRELLIRLLRRYPVILSEHCFSSFRTHDESGAGGPAGRYPAELEYAQLFSSYGSPGDDHARRRRQVARYYHGKALMTFAKYHPGQRLASMAALCRALWYRPTLPGHPNYYKVWLQVLGLLPPLRRLKSALASRL